MLIYLLRHGLTEYNAQKRYQGQRDIPLSAEGLSQLQLFDEVFLSYAMRKEKPSVEIYEEMTQQT